MSTRSLLHHPCHARLPSFIGDSRFLLLRRSLFSYSGINTLRRSFLSTPTSFSVNALKAVDVLQARNSPQAMLEYSDTEAVEYVNKRPPGPMVEVDPVTIFRRIIAERRASLDTARAKRQADGGTVLQSTGTQPFFNLSRWSNKSTIAIALAIVLLVLATVVFFLRSRARSDEKTELTSAEEKDSIDGSASDGRHKLVDDSIQAPESIRTAMTIGAASIGRSKGHSISSLGTTNRTNGNMVDSQSLNAAEPTAFEDIKTEGYGNYSFGQFPYNPNNKEELLDSFKTQGTGIDVAEGPWFGHAAGDSESLDSSSEASFISQEAVSNEKISNKFASEVSKNDTIYQNSPLANVVDGEFLGEVSSSSVMTEEAWKEPLRDDKNFQIERFELEEPEDDAILGDNSAILEKLEQVIRQESVSRADDMIAIGKTDTSKQDQLPLVTKHDRGEESETNHSFIPSQLDKVVLMDAPEGEVDGDNEQSSSFDGEVLTPASFESMTADLINREQNADGSNLMTHQYSGKVPHTSTADAPLISIKEHTREENRKALEAAVPALAIGVGTVGTLLGVAGGLQVVGFAALANFVSHDCFWAQSRADFYQELKGITTRQKLLEFLARRNILTMDEKEANL